MKKIVFILVVAFISFFGGNYIVHKTSDDKFCASCHEWMSPMVQAYHASPHGGASPLGIKASCATCHLPHDTFGIAYIAKKLSNGISEVSYMLLNDPAKYDWQKNRENRENYVYDSGCLTCHANIGNEIAKNENVRDMHDRWLRAKDLPKSERISCVSCHKNVGHEELGKILYERENPPVGQWNEEEKSYPKK